MGIEHLNRSHSEVDTLNYGNESREHELVEKKTCVDCNSPFTITEGEANYFVQHGLVAPKRCKSCRAERKANPTSRIAGVPTPITEQVSITCDHCGRDAKVPFSPFPGSPVYCKVCWVGIKNVGTPPNYNSPK